jgi:molybdopterin-containing oxidoreductase family iron-sulfur binding subunit
MQQAAILSLYDPDRSARFLENGKPTAKSWKEFDAYLKTLSLGDGSGLRFLSETVNSPSLMAMRADAMKKFPKAKWAEYDPTSGDNGTEMAFGQKLTVQPQYDKAKVVLALDADFLGLDSPTPLPTKQFSKRRRIETEDGLEKLNRLYMVEAQFSITGMNADHRLRVKPSEVKQFAMDLAAAVGAVPGLSVVGGSDRRSKFIAAVVKDLKSAGAEALVVAGPRQPVSVHAAAAAINQALGSTAVMYIKAEGSDNGADALKSLVAEMAGGQVSTLFILGGNPVYSAPADLQFNAALLKVANSVHLGEEEDETAYSAKWHVPQAHFLEQWSDARAIDGTVSIQQPLIDCMYGGKTPAEMVALLIDAPNKKAYDIVKKFWMSQMPGKDAEKTWRKALNDGIVAAVNPMEAAKVSVDTKKLAAALAAEPKAAASTGLEVTFVPSSSTWDGRFANNGWMQEAPDPISKLVWGNAALMSPSTAKAQNVADSDIVTISRANYKVDAAVMVQPGLADGVIAFSLGYGRTKCGRVGSDVGFNANLIRTSDGFWNASGFSVASTGRTFKFATTQERGLADHQNDRPIVREVMIEDYKKNPKVIEEMNETSPLHSIYPELAYNQGNQWGMAIDLGACTGCNACVVACQAENNIPVVGKDQVIRGREMHWIRMDRYYTGTEDEPRAVAEPVPCMQCENAPCENVCPVAATSHSPEGLNDMAYNRCVGTRYCANNCPFKVRHFNFLNFHKHEPAIESMAYNPDVTVRMRGVMEKCTYCVQRIQETKIKAQGEGRRAIPDGEIKTACQQTCPAEAIVFGNINDPQSRVSKLKKQERNYAMLAELDIRPRTTYLAKVRNPNPELEA